METHAPTLDVSTVKEVILKSQKIPPPIAGAHQWRGSTWAPLRECAWGASYEQSTLNAADRAALKARLLDIMQAADRVEAATLEREFDRFNYVPPELFLGDRYDPETPLTLEELKAAIKENVEVGFIDGVGLENALAMKRTIEWADPEQADGLLQQFRIEYVDYGASLLTMTWPSADDRINQ